MRHPAFFSKGADEQALNRGLHERKVNRAILDSRPIHSAVPQNEAVREAQRKKPKVPVHTIVTASNPLARFIGSNNMEGAKYAALFDVWLKKLPEWATKTTPYLY